MPEAILKALKRRNPLCPRRQQEVRIAPDPLSDLMWHTGSHLQGFPQETARPRDSSFQGHCTGPQDVATSGDRSSSGAIGNSERRTPRRRVEHAPRTSQGPRPTVAAYVPPAMRERARNAGENEEEPKNKLRWFRRSERD